MKTVVAIYHVAFEDLDEFATVFSAHGYEVRYVDATRNLDTQLIEKADIVAILGGPIGVYQADTYPFLYTELDIAKSRLYEGKPVLGICLGAQIMAKALGSDVYPGKAGKELGWSDLRMTHEGYRHPIASLDRAKAKVLHWHGDTFDLPVGADLLASTEYYKNQVFSFGKHGLALQCHAEVSASGLERWYVGHASELASSNIDILEFRGSGIKNCEILSEPGREFLSGWLSLFEDK
ncbi:MAG TPA: glutamine amidotransferase [Burkholderiales bacterium]|nr:glutamine amidotransferase [Burkholderiales bacterium]